MSSIELNVIIKHLDAIGVEYDFIGDRRTMIEGFSSLKNYKPKTITWIKNSIIYNENEQEQQIECCVTNEKIISNSISNQIIVKNSKRIFFKILEAFFATPVAERRIGEGTYIGKDVVIGKNVSIGHNCTIDGDITIGEGTIIGNNVVIINRVTIGDRCQIQALSVIGEDGFGYVEDETNKKDMIKHYGGVVIEDDVFIGSHVNIARGTIDDTIIKEGVKIAPTTHIGHNVIIERDTTVICSKVFGSVWIGENAYLSSCVVRNQCEIGSNVVVGMGAVVTKNVAPNRTVMGIPAKNVDVRR